ncbi:MAG: HD domain-containing protein [Bacteroidales bacterium]|nr:HD domain-containing protein [Bacteroidales bacterium]
MASLQQWVEESVLPQYSRFDAAHREEHARRVVARAMALYRHLRERLAPPTAPIATMMPEMVFTAAAMHDLGLAEGREEHHLASGRIIRACRDLRRWFDEQQVETIAQAAEDHRASATTPPRSMLGRIIAEADRDVEPERIVRRTVEYGLSHYPTLDREGHWQRTLEHLREKYAEGGYIKLWLADSPNAAPLAELRALIADQPRLRRLFDSIISNTYNL